VAEMQAAWSATLPSHDVASVGTSTCKGYKACDIIYLFNVNGKPQGKLQI
jgi:hypothetical protein